MREACASGLSGRRRDEQAHPQHGVAHPERPAHPAQPCRSVGHAGEPLHASPAQGRVIAKAVRECRRPIETGRECDRIHERFAGAPAESLGIPWAASPIRATRSVSNVGNRGTVNLVDALLAG